ncbi:group III truncated hemoglobin [Desertibaculum subflavum]|uniref:group III truncated hemoglobin n=1 Tax=Desertibaculum subflavum TaxID=2268458 RepID=UPI0034D36994
MQEVEGGPEKRARLVAEIRARTGIDEAMIHRLVHGFYAKVRADDVLGPVFDAAIADWAPHLAKMCDFWSSVALMSGRYHGQPMPAHLKLPIEARHFDRWLALFEATAAELCPPAAAAHFVERARRIADSFELGRAFATGNIQKGPLPSQRRVRHLQREGDTA